MEAVATVAPCLTATAGATDSCHCLPKRSFKQHIADIKNISGNDPATLKVELNSANILQSFEIFVYEIANDAPWLTAMVVATDSCRHLPKRLLKRHIADVKNILSNDQVTLIIAKALKFTSIRSCKAYRNSTSCCWLLPF